MKKKLFVLATTCLIALPLVGCKANKKTGGEAHLWYSYSTENFLSDLDYMDEEMVGDAYLDRDSTLRFHALKNEHEGMQLMISAKSYVSSFDFVAPDVISENGKVITKDHFAVSAARYIEVDSPFERESFSGWYPDALVPLENYKWKGHNFIEENRNQAIYVDLSTDESVEPGLYKGNGTLILDGKEYSIPFEVNIYDNVMPIENHRKSCFLIWYYKIAEGELKNDTPELEMKYYDTAIEYRISPDGLPEAYESDYNSFADIYYEKVVKDPRIPSYRAPYVNNTSRLEGDVIELLSALAEKQIEVINEGDNTSDLFEKLLYYVNDEPSAAMFDDVRARDLAITNGKRYVADKYFSDIKYEKYKNSLLSIPNLVTTQFNEELVGSDTQGGVQTWCPQFQHFNTPSNRDLYKSRLIKENTNREYGEGVWFYGCMDPRAPYPSYHLDIDLLMGRAITWMQYDYNIQGQVYWNLCYYSKEFGGIESARDVWNDPVVWEGCVGDGMFYYPGLIYGIDGPIPTLRLESLRASGEEYEYLYLLDNYVKKYNEAHSTSYDFNTLYQNSYSAIFKNMQPTCDVLDFEEVRINTLKLLEKFNTSLDDGMNMLLNK